MTHKKRTDKEMERLNEEIIWNSERQRRVRRRVIRGMEYNRDPSVSWMKRRFVPAFSLLLLLTIVTTIFLSEFTGQEVADNGNNPTPDGDDNSSQLVTNNHSDNNNDEKNDEGSNSSPGTNVDENNNTQTNTPETVEPQQEESNERILSEEEVIHAIKEQISTNLNIQLPKSLPLSEGDHLTAVTDSVDNKYEVIFYENDEPIPINNKLLFSEENPAEVVARLTVQQYDTQEEANELIAHEEFDEQSGKEVKLGSKLKGYQDAGAGSTWTRFNIGRWAFATHASIQHSERGVALAKDAVDYLQENMLPIPKQNGFIHLDAENDDNRIQWEKEMTVYTIDQVDDPMDALDIAIDFQ